MTDDANDDGKPEPSTKPLASPRSRARAHLQRMLRAASLAVVAGCGDDGTTSSSDPCSPDGCDPLPPPTTSTSDTDGATSTTGGADSTGSTTWDDPCSPDGCDPLPPPTTSETSDTDTETGTGTGSGTGGSGTSGTSG